MSNIKLYVIGCGDAFGSGGKRNTCYFFKMPDFNFCIDFGATSMQGLKENNFTSNDIDLIIISHFHGDHFGAMPNLLLEAAKVYRRKKPLTIISPINGKARIAETLEAMYKGTSGILDELNLEFLEFDNKSGIEWRGLRLETFPVIHAETSIPHGLKIKFNKKKIGFSGDTSWTDALYEISDDTDLFICECNFFEIDGAGHLNYQQILKNHSKFNTKSLWLSHPGEEMIQHISDVDLSFLSDNMVIDI